MAQPPEQGPFEVTWCHASRRTPPLGPDFSTCSSPWAWAALSWSKVRIKLWQQEQGRLEGAIGQTLWDRRERERGIRALNQNHFQAQICKTKTVDSLFLTSGFSCRVFPLFLGCKGTWWHVASPSCHFFEINPALQERQREPSHS